MVEQLLHIGFMPADVEARVTVVRTLALGLVELEEGDTGAEDDDDDDDDVVAWTVVVVAVEEIAKAIISAQEADVIVLPVGSRCACDCILFDGAGSV